MDKPSFANLNLSPEVQKAIAALGFEEASPIQAATIPPLLEGRDLVGQSQTGSGKTAAFAIPAIEATNPDDRSTQILILCPTRELATQVAEEVHKLALFKKGVHAVPIYGGASYERQFYELKKGVQIVIGTPGRTIDHLERGTLDISKLKTVILDEADRMLDMGFREDIERILQDAPKERQTVFFSATVSPAIRDLINRFSNNPVSVKIDQRELTVPTVEQLYYEVPPKGKLSALLRIIDFHNFKLGIIFCNTQRMVDDLADQLLAQGFSADRLHGGIAQAQRTRVMNKFKKAEFEFLVATDVAARGIDVDDLEVVVNYDLPYDAEDYVHRIGRTGRAGRRGVALTFVGGRDIYKLQFIERFTKTKIRRAALPTSGEVEERRNSLLIEKIRATLQEGNFDGWTPLVDRLLEEGFMPTDISASLLQLLAGGSPKNSPLPPPEQNSQQQPPPRQEKHQRDQRDEKRPRPEQKEREESPRQTETKRERPTPPEKTPARPPENEPRKNPPEASAAVMLDVGKADGLKSSDILEFLKEVFQAPAESVGTINIDTVRTIAHVDPAFLTALQKKSKMRIPTEIGTVTVSLIQKTPARNPQKPAHPFHKKFSKKQRP